MVRQSRILQGGENFRQKLVSWEAEMVSIEYLKFQNKNWFCYKRTLRWRELSSKLVSLSYVSKEYMSRDLCSNYDWFGYILVGFAKPITEDIGLTYGGEDSGTKLVSLHGEELKQR
jgi:hypothetical protein